MEQRHHSQSAGSHELRRRDERRGVSVRGKPGFMTQNPLRETFIGPSVTRFANDQNKNMSSQAGEQQGTKNRSGAGENDLAPGQWKSQFYSKSVQKYSASRRNKSLCQVG